MANLSNKKFIIAGIISGLVLLTTACSGTDTSSAVVGDSTDYELEYKAELQQLKEHILANQADFMEEYTAPALAPGTDKNPEDYTFTLEAAGIDADENYQCLVRFTSKKDESYDILSFSLDADCNIKNSTVVYKAKKATLGPVETEATLLPSGTVPNSEPDFSFKGGENQ